MVRVKSRWIIVEIFQDDDEYDDDAVGSGSSIKPPSMMMMNNNKNNKTARSNLYHALRYTIDSAFGVAGAGMIENIQGGQE